MELAAGIWALGHHRPALPHLHRAAVALRAERVVFLIEPEHARAQPYG